MTKQKSLSLNNFIKLLPPVLFIILGGMFFVLALQVYFADSEIWLLTLSQQALNPGHLSSIYYKWSFHIATYVFSHFAPTELAVYDWARAGWSAVAMASILGISRLFTRLYKIPGLFWPLAIFLLTSSLFFNQGFRIRGDIFSLFLHTVYLLVFVGAFQNTQKWRPFLFLLVLNILLALSSPKFILFAAAQVVLGFFIVKRSELTDARKKDMLWLLISSHTAMVMMASGSALLSALIPGSYNLLSPIGSAVDFYLKSFDPSYGNIGFLSAEDFQYFWRFLKLSWVHSIVLIAWLALSVVQWGKIKNSPLVGLQIYAWLILIFVIFYNQKFPFFLGPFLTPVLAQALCSLYAALQARRLQTHSTPLLRLMVAGVILASSVQAFLRYSENIEFNNNKHQKAAIVKLEAHSLAHPDLKIYDVIGLLPRKNTIFAFIGPGEVARKTEILKLIENADPDMIIQTYKSHFLDPEFVHMLTAQWVPVERNVWVKGFHWIKTKHPEKFAKTTEINNRPYWALPWPGKKYFSDLVSVKPIDNETYKLDGNLQVTTGEPVYLAVPQKYWAIVFTDIPAVGFSNPPNVLFRYDTSF